MATVDVSRECPDLYATHQQAAQPASALRISHPAATAINHHLGHLLGGVHVFQAAAATPGTQTGKFRYEIPRHPNCDYLCVIVTFDGLTAPVQEEDCLFTVRAGTGAPQTYNATWGAALEAAFESRVVIMAPWDSNDSGVCPFSTSSVQLGVRSLVVADWPRTTLDNGEHCVEFIDGTYPRCGLRQEDTISDSATGGVKALLQGVQYCWDDFLPSVVQWSDPRDAPRKITPTSTTAVYWFMKPDNSHSFKRRAPQKASTSETTTCSVGAYAWFSSAGASSYALTAGATNPGPAAADSVSEESLTNSTGDGGVWVDVGDLEIDCTTPTAIYLGGYFDASTGAIYLGGLSITRKAG